MRNLINLFKADWKFYLSALIIGAIFVIALTIPTEKIEIESGSEPTETKIFDYITYRDIMSHIGFNGKESKYMYNYCTTMNNPNNCMILSAGISYYETKGGTIGVGTKGKNNLYGLMQYTVDSNGEIYQIPKFYPNRMAGFEDWVERYNEFRYKNDCNEMVTKSRYTTTDIEAWIASCVRIEQKFYE